MLTEIVLVQLTVLMANGATHLISPYLALFESQLTLEVKQSSMAVSRHWLYVAVHDCKTKAIGSHSPELVDFSLMATVAPYAKSLLFLIIYSLTGYFFALFLGVLYAKIKAAYR